MSSENGRSIGIVKDSHIRTDGSGGKEPLSVGKIDGFETPYAPGSGPNYKLGNGRTIDVEHERAVFSALQEEFILRGSCNEELLAVTQKKLNQVKKST